MEIEELGMIQQGVEHIGPIVSGISVYGGNLEQLCT